MKAKDRLGKTGEDVAAEHLERLGWVILDRNWRGSGGELDLVGYDGLNVIAVEVKTRSSEYFGHPLEAISPEKVRRLHRLLFQWLREHESPIRIYRVDAIGIVMNDLGEARIEHVKAIGE